MGWIFYRDIHFLRSLFYRTIHEEAYVNIIIELRDYYPCDARSGDGIDLAWELFAIIIIMMLEWGLDLTLSMSYMTLYYCGVIDDFYNDLLRLEEILAHLYHC